jgi:hypothetical protein
MKLIHTVALLAAAASLASCAPTRSQYEVAVTALEGSPRLQQHSYNDCMKREPSATWKKSAAIVMNVPDSKASSTFCRRAVDGLASRRITYADFSSAYNGQFTPNLVKVMQGR